MPVSKRPLIALVTFVAGAGHTGFKFIDCRAEYVREDGADPPGGYGAHPTQRDGEWHSPCFSHVTGLFFGSIECDIYPAQFGMPHAPGEFYHFWAGPQEILEACRLAVLEEKYPADYSI